MARTGEPRAQRIGSTREGHPGSIRAEFDRVAGRGCGHASPGGECYTKMPSSFLAVYEPEHHSSCDTMLQSVGAPFALRSCGSSSDASICAELRAQLPGTAHRLHFGRSVEGCHAPDLFRIMGRLVRGNMDVYA